MKKQIMSTLSLTLLLSSPLILNAGKRKKIRMPAAAQSASNANPQGAITTSTTLVTDNEQKEEELEEDFGFLSQWNEGDNSTTNSTTQIVRDTTQSLLDDLITQRNAAQQAFSTTLVYLAQLKRLELETLARMQETRNKQAKESLDIWKLSTKIKVLQRGTNPNNTIDLDPNLEVSFEAIENTTSSVSTSTAIDISSETTTTLNQSNNPFTEKKQEDDFEKVENDSLSSNNIADQQPQQQRSNNNNNINVNISSSMNNNNNNNALPNTITSSSTGSWLGWLNPFSK